MSLTNHTTKNNNSTSPSSSTPSATNPTCPESHNLNYTTSTGPNNNNNNNKNNNSPSQSQKEKTFRIQCGVDYPGGDGTLGLVQQQQQEEQQGRNNITSLAACLDACAARRDCVGAVFRPRGSKNSSSSSGGDGDGDDSDDGGGDRCWLKQFIGVAQPAVEGAQSGVLWQ